jgi:hypothetical protein
MVSNQGKLIAGVRAWCALNVEQFRAAGAEDTGEALEDVVKAWIAELRRQNSGRNPTLAYLKKLKAGVRLADAILDVMLGQFPTAMKGWWAECQPTNSIQAFYSEVFRMALQLGMSAASIEAEYFPEFAAYFAQERAEYQRKSDQLKIERTKDKIACRVPVTAGDAGTESSVAPRPA